MGTVSCRLMIRRPRAGGIGPDVTGRTERHQAVELEVRAPLGALDEVVDLEGAAAAGLVPPAGAPEQLWRAH